MHDQCPAEVHTHARTKAGTHVRTLMQIDAQLYDAAVSGAVCSDDCSTDLPEYGVGNRRRKDAMIQDRYDPYMVRMARVRMTIIRSVHGGGNGLRTDDHDPYATENGMHTDHHDSCIVRMTCYGSSSSVHVRM